MLGEEAPSPVSKGAKTKSGGDASSRCRPAAPSPRSSPSERSEAGYEISWPGLAAAEDVGFEDPDVAIRVGVDPLLSVGGGRPLGGDL